VGVDLGVAFGVDLGLAFGVDLGLDFGLALGVVVAPVKGVLVLVAVGAGAGVGVVGVVGGVGGVEAEDATGGVVVVVPSANPVAVPNCGGVIDNTTPRPVTVPPAIKKKRLVITGVSPNQPHEIQILRCGNDRAGYQLRAPPYARSRLDQLGHRYKHQNHQRLGLTW
jgi:hypothetical protein